MTLLALVLAVVLVGAAVAVRRNEAARRRAAAATVDLVVDDDGIRRRLADGRREAIAWEEVTGVDVITTDVGVHAEDGVLIVVHGDEHRGCLVPSRQAAATDLLARLARLPRFDSRALGRAMALDPPSQTTIWERPGPQPEVE